LRCKGKIAASRRTRRSFERFDPGGLSACRLQQRYEQEDSSCDRRKLIETICGKRCDGSFSLGFLGDTGRSDQRTNMLMSRKALRWLVAVAHEVPPIAIELIDNL
jgi:hypothetical protein